MVLTDAQKYYAMYVIGAVESNWDWTAVYYVDPITIGMTQFYAYNAARLLNRLKQEAFSNYALLAQSLRDDVESHDENSNWWTGRYLTRDEGNSWVIAAQEDENHAVQQTLFFEDLDGYINKITSWGISDDNVKEAIFIACEYHQSPARTGRVIADVGANATLAALRIAFLNDSILGNYKNRINEAYNLLKDWDEVTEPPDFGQVKEPDYSGGDSGTSGTQPASAVSYIRSINNGANLVIYGTNFPNGLYCSKAGTDIYIPAVNTSGGGASTGTGGTTGGGGETSDIGQKIVDLYKSWENKFVYAQAPGRLSPLTSGLTDCSASIWAAYHEINSEIEIGTWTGEQHETGKLIISGGANDEIDITKLHLADVILINYYGTSASGIGHAILVTSVNGNGEAWHMTAQRVQVNGKDGPRLLTSNLKGPQTSWKYWEVRRYF